MQELLLAGNQVGDQAARDLAAALPGVPSLRVLHLQDNHSIGTDGATGLGLALTACHCLTELDLSRSHLGSDGARLLAQVGQEQHQAGAAASRQPRTATGLRAAIS